MALSTTFLVIAALAPALAHPGAHDDLLPRQFPSLCKRQISCLLAPQLTEGPYYYSQSAVPIRSNITEDRPGIPLRLSIRVIDVNNCSPVKDAAVDIWHADAGGVYSHYVANSVAQNGGRPGAGSSTTDNSTFLRGIQLTDSNGTATFQTIFPGWYVGRTVHIHIKVHLDGTLSTDSKQYIGGTLAHTGQLFFTESITAALDSFPAYTRTSGTRMTNAQDRIYGSQGGDYGILEMSGSPGNEEFGGAIGVGISGGSDSSGATAVNTATKTVTATNAATMGASTTAAAVVATTSGKPSKGDRLFSGLGKVAAGLVGTVLYYVL